MVRTKSQLCYAVEAQKPNFTPTHGVGERQLIVIVPMFSII